MGTGFSNWQTGCHLAGVYRVPRAGLEAWLGVHITIVVVVASTGVLALVPWGVRGLYEAPAIEHKACPPTMGGEPPSAIQHHIFLSPPEGGLDLVTNRKGAI